jgi:hypoxanthine phosphoribosyltransferase
LEYLTLNAKEKELSFIAPSWQYIEHLSFKLYMLIRDSSFRPDLLAGISRGGLVPARIISDLYLAENKKVTLSIMQVGFYSGINKRQKQPIIYQDLPGHIYGKKILLLDDVADSGISIEFAKTYLAMKKPLEVKVGTLYYKPFSKIIPDYYVEETTSWIVFPHERYEFMNEHFMKGKMSNPKLKDFFIKEVGIDPSSVKNFLQFKESIS